MHPVEMPPGWIDVPLRTFLSKIQEELRKREEVREEIQKTMRKATRLSKQAILFTHQKRFKDARKLLRETDKLFMELCKVGEVHPTSFTRGS